MLLGIIRISRVTREQCLCNVGKNVHSTIPKGNTGYAQYTVPNDCSCRIYFGCFPLAITNITSQTSRTILSNFFEEQCTQKHPQYLSGLSRTLFPTTFLEIAVYLAKAKYEALVRSIEKCLSEIIQLSPKARAKFNFF